MLSRKAEEECDEVSFCTHKEHTCLYLFVEIYTKLVAQKTI